MKTTGLIVLIVIIAASGCYGLQNRASPQPAKTTKDKPAKGVVADPAACGTLDDVAKKVEVCAKPMMDILQGSLEKWPRTDEDAQNHCNLFVGSERCIRDVSRKCAKGIHKTIISTLANSISRARKRECVGREKMPAVLKTMMCIEKRQEIVHNWMANVTGRLNVVETQMPDTTKKISSLCCMVNDIEKEIKDILNPHCPEEAKLITRLYRGVLDDAIDIICRNPKCNDYLKGYKITTNTDFSGIISVMLRIVFSLDV